VLPDKEANMAKKEKKVKEEVVQENTEPQAVGTRSFSIFESIKDDDGTWRVTISLGEAVSWDGKEWDEETIEAMCLDDKFEVAFDKAKESAFEQYNEEVTLAGFGSLYDARQAKKVLAEKSQE